MEEEYYKTKEILFEDIDFTTLDGGQLGFLWDDITKIVIECESNKFIGSDRINRGVDEFEYGISYTATSDGKLTLNVFNIELS
ncbi:MAG: hypothetical protein NTY74_14670 [Ignavibacteriae bacterium]|nr:hypothetical protein [Ignavibacteriota bacterium]